MNRKLEELFYEFFDVCSVFIGYEVNEELLNVLTSIFDFIGKIIKLDKESIIRGEKIITDIFSINKYSDYILTKTKYCKLDSDLLRYGAPYFNELSRLDNKVSHFNKIYVKKQLDELSLEGNIRVINLKAYLKFLGIIYEKNIEEAIELFKLSAYSDNYFSFNILSKITNEKTFYFDIYKRITNQLDYYDYRKKDLYMNIIMECHKKTLESKKINYDLINYVLTSCESHEIVLYKIKKNLYKRIDHVKIGF